jgi:high-affinity K+ transport system ATPase subunit B
MPLSTHVRLLDASEPGFDGPVDKLAFEMVLASRLKAGDLVLCTEGDFVPADGVVVEGIASIAERGVAEDGVDGAPLTGPRLRVQRGLRLLSGYLVVRVAA